ncbi:MAG TPA: hypothetical protein PKN28_06170 [Clostridiales bacterium]|nr:hypothetical protein [Clostridiales bacterium]
MSEDRQCKAILDDGEQCGAYALKGKDYCFSHDPSSREAKLEAVRNGGLVKKVRIDEPLTQVDIVTAKDVVRLLTVTIEEVRTGKLDPRIANTIGFLAGHLTRAYEIAELEQKVDEIRAVIKGRTPMKDPKGNRRNF